MESSLGDQREGYADTLEVLGMSLTQDQRDQYEREALDYLRSNPSASDADLVAIMERVQAE